MTEREEFEAWAKTKNMDLTPFDTTFDSDFTSHAWDGWQAARRTVSDAQAECGAANAMLTEEIESLRKSRAEIIDECAKVCDEGVKWSPKITGKSAFYVEGTARALAREIRSLANKEGA